MTSPRPVPLASADIGDRLDDARLYLSNLLASADADAGEVAEARAVVSKLTRAVRDSRRQWISNSARLDREAP